MTGAEIIAAAGYKLVTWPEFEQAGDVPDFIRKLAQRVHAKHGGAFVVYDPAGGTDGWLLVEDDRNLLILETLDYIQRDEEPAPQPSLF